MTIVGLALARPYCTMYRCILNSARVPGKLYDSNAEILPDPLSSLAVGGVWRTRRQLVQKPNLLKVLQSTTVIDKK